jgi:hypothetical protein
MTIQSQTARLSFICNGTSTVFPVNIQSYNASDFLVLVTNVATGLSTPLTLNSDYTLVSSGTLAPTFWTLTTQTGQLPSPYVSGNTLQVILNPTETQLTQYVQGQAFPSLAVQTNIDRLTQIDIRQSDILSRAIVAPDGDVSPVMALPIAALRKSTNLGFDVNGNVALNLALASGTISTATLAPFLGLSQTVAEALAGVTPVNLAYAPGDVRRYGAIGDGVTNDAAALTTAYSVGGTIFHPALNYFLGITSVNVPANTKLTFSKGAKFTVTATPASMPQAYLNITGSNVEIDGAVGFIAANPFSTYAAKGAFIGFGASNISNIKIRNCDSNWFMHGILGSSFAATVANSVSNVVIERCRFTSYACDIYHTGLSPLNWLIDGTIHDGTRVTPSNNAGAIQINAGVDIANVNNFTQSIYDSGYGQKIKIVNCEIGAMVDRPIRIMNCQQVNVSNNDLALNIGSFFSGLFSADAVTFDLCRKVTCHDNTIFGGGENGIDVLSCQDIEVHDNVIKQCNTTGVFVFLSDLWNASVTSPKLSSITTRTSLQTSNVNVHDNYIEAYDDIHIAAGQNVKVHDNLLKLFKTSTNWISGSNPDLLSLDNTAGAAYFGETSFNWMHDVECKGNKPVLVSVSNVACNSGTGVFTTSGGVPHGFVTGDRIETVAAGTSTTVDYPAGLDYKLDYYVIFVSTSTFKLASTLVNAFAGTAITLTTNGLTVSGSALFVREQTYPASINISSTNYYSATNIVLDENIGFVSTNLFSTLATIVPGTSLLFKNYKHQFIYDPAVNYTLARNIIDKYYGLPQGRASDGTVVYGIAATSATSGGYSFAVGAKPGNIVGSPADGYIKTSFW